MHFYPLTHQHRPVNYSLLGMTAGVIVIPTVFLALLFMLAHLV